MPLYYFASVKRMDINLTDNKQSTPLHWACYSRSESALNFILSLNPNLEAQDQKGLTALHLAVKGVEQLKSARAVKALLTKGANRFAKDNDGRKPVDYIGENLPDVFKRDLKSMLKKPRTCCRNLMVKSPLTKVEPSHTLQIWFWSLSVVLYFSLYFILYPNLPVWYYSISSFMVGIKMYIPYVLCTRRDPGKLTATDEQPLDFMELLKVFAPSELCPDCKVIKTPRSKHCSVCNVCVERYDHHCPWLNNCVGAKTAGSYLTFVCFWWVLCLLIMCIAMDCLGRGPMADTRNSPFGPACFAGICNVPWV